jgi:hypothetical protein
MGRKEIISDFSAKLFQEPGLLENTVTGNET